MSRPEAESAGLGRWRWANALGLLALGVLGAVLYSVPAVRQVDLQWQGVLTRVVSVRSAPENVTIIDIDERSLHEIGPWPWPRPVLAQLSERLRERGARLQVWDLFFSQPTPADTALIAQLGHPDVVIGQVPVLDPLVQAPPREGRWVVSDTAPELCSVTPALRGYLGVAESFLPVQAGHLAATPDADGQLRRLPAVLCASADIPAPTGLSGQAISPAKAQRSAQLVLAAAAADAAGHPWLRESGNGVFGPAHWLRRGVWAFPVDADGYISIPYQRPHTAWPAVSASRLLDPDAELPSLKNHVVLIGGTALGLRDVVSTPFHPNAPGVSVHAELLAAGQSGERWPGLVPRGAPLLAGIATVLAALLLVPLARPGRRLVAVLTGVVVIAAGPLILSLLARLAAGLVLPVAGPILALLVNGLGLMAWQIHQHRRRVRELSHDLQSFLPPTLAQQVAAQVPSGHSLGQPCDGVLAAVRITGLQRWVSRVDTLQGLALIHALHSTAANTLRTQGGQLEHAQGEVFYISWPDNDAQSVRRALDGLRQLLNTLLPILERNAREDSPLSFYAAFESGVYLLGLVGGNDARRCVLLGPVANDVAGMLTLSEELDSPILIGPQAAHLLVTELHEPLQGMGQFVLPDQRHPKTLFRVPL